MYCPCGDSHQKISCKLVLNQFLAFAKDYKNFNFYNVHKITPCIFFKIDKVIKIINLGKKTTFLLFQDFWGKLNFSESVLFHREMFGLTYFGLDIDVYIENSIIFITKYCTTFFRISFNKLLKGTTILITTIL